jgi:hypothetical protein
VPAKRVTPRRTANTEHDAARAASADSTTSAASNLTLRSVIVLSHGSEVIAFGSYRRRFDPTSTYPQKSAYSRRDTPSTERSRNRLGLRGYAPICILDRGGRLESSKDRKATGSPSAPRRPPTLVCPQVADGVQAATLPARARLPCSRVAQKGRAALPADTTNLPVIAELRRNAWMQRQRFPQRLRDLPFARAGTLTAIGKARFYDATCSARRGAWPRRAGSASLRACRRARGDTRNGVASRCGASHACPSRVPDTH